MPKRTPSDKIQQELASLTIPWYAGSPLTATSPGAEAPGVEALSWLAMKMALQRNSNTSRVAEQEYPTDERQLSPRDRSPHGSRKSKVVLAVVLSCSGVIGISICELETELSLTTMVTLWVRLLTRGHWKDHTGLVESEWLLVS